MRSLSLSVWRKDDLAREMLADGGPKPASVIWIFSLFCLTGDVFLAAKSTSNYKVEK